MSDYIKASIAFIVGAVLLSFGIYALPFGEGSAIWIILCGLIALLISQWMIAKLFAKVAKEKGYTDSNIVFFIFITSFAGYLYVISLPNKRVNSDANESGRKKFDSDELPEL